MMVSKFLAPYTMYIKAGLAIALAGGIVFVYLQAKHWYSESIAAAVEQGRQEVLATQARLLNEAERRGREENIQELVELRKELLASKNEVTTLRRKLQVDHELDALLQAKPGLVLKAVQNGTNEVLFEFEEITRWEE
jgi:hypothetical protein